jgi:hypothetical protein
VRRCFGARAFVRPFIAAENNEEEAFACGGAEIFKRM